MKAGRIETQGGTYSPAVFGAFASSYNGFVHVYAVRFPADIPADMMPTEAREFAARLTAAADEAEALEVKP